MNIVIPMAGRGSRLSGWQKNLPKPLITVSGRPMIAWAIESLQGLSATRLIFVVLSEHEKLFGMTQLLIKLTDFPAEIVVLNDLTEGQLCTVLTTKQWIDCDDDLLIASADTLVRSDLAQDISKQPDNCHGIISVANLPGENWSFARTDISGRVVQVAEKIRISEYASTGLYYFRNGHDFVTVADELISNQQKTRGEYYVIPVYQKYIERKWVVGISKAKEVWDMGNPEAIMNFERNYVEKR